MGDIRRVVWGRWVAKRLEKLPVQIGRKFQSWVRAVALLGLRDVRKLPGFHDEPLSGKREGQRSIRLSRSWRAIYIQRLDGTVELVEVIEVHKHEY